MPDTIREQIVKKVAAKLALITTGNGYANTINNVQRFNESGQLTALVPYIVIHEGDETSVDKPDPLITNVLQVELEVVTRQDQSADARSSEELMNTLRGDVRKAMMSNRGWDGLAIDTKPVASSAISVFEGESDLTMYMDFELHYRHRNTDPTSLT